MPIMWAGVDVEGWRKSIARQRAFADAFPAANIRHHFTGQDHAHGVYAKELHIPAGYDLVSHAHPYDHLSILALGSVFWKAGDIAARLITGPCVLIVESGVEHELHALTDAVWFCIHPTDETDPDKVDPAILKRGEV